MIEALCGSKNIQKILLFLFVNGKCYGTQLHQSLKTSLTPLQKGLARLEKGGIIISYYEGKTRLYQFNPAYPLLSELELLLKKAYTLLPAHEKKNFYVSKEDAIANQDIKSKTLFAFWKRLGEVQHLTFHARSKSKDEQNWDGKGQGDVIVNKEGDNILIFSEKGSWQGKQGNEMIFSNMFRWTLDRFAGIISLEHLRRGFSNPVFLLHLAPVNKHILSSVDAHLCAGDTYFGQIHFDRHSIRFNWRVIGPKKNEEMDYFYS